VLEQLEIKLFVSHKIQQNINVDNNDIDTLMAEMLELKDEDSDEKLWKN
jgi:hypothetical protein